LDPLGDQPVAPGSLPELDDLARLRPEPLAQQVVLVTAMPRIARAIGVRPRIDERIVPCQAHIAPRLPAAEALEILSAPLFAGVEANLNQRQDGHQDREEGDRAEGE